MPEGEVSDWRMGAAQEALHAYVLSPGAVSVQQLNHTNNWNYRIDVRSTRPKPHSFVLRIHRRSDVPVRELGSELEWLMAIRAAADLQVPAPVRTQDGTLFGVIPVASDGLPHYHVLFRWLDARFVPTHAQTGSAAAQVGAFIGALHQFSQSFTPEFDFRRRRLDAEQLFDWSAVEAGLHPYGIFTVAHRRLFEMVHQRIRDIFSLLDTRSNTFGLIHADLIWNNYFFHARGVGAVDFEDCGWGYYLYDLAPTLVGYYDEPHYAALRAGLLAGYRSKAP
jgi:Ser/Thr protein kinase RdoA (MazF antagonist)